MFLKAVVILCMAGIVISGYILVRNERVSAFRLGIIWLASDTADRLIEKGRDFEFLYRMCEKYSYERMLYSLRPLRLEEWYTDEEIKMFKGEDIL